jgi:hypothetical protein
MNGINSRSSLWSPSKPELVSANSISNLATFWVRSKIVKYHERGSAIGDPALWGLPHHDSTTERSHDHQYYFCFTFFLSSFNFFPPTARLKRDAKSLATNLNERSRTLYRWSRSFRARIRLFRPLIGIHSREIVLCGLFPINKWNSFPLLCSPWILCTMIAISSWVALKPSQKCSYVIHCIWNNNFDLTCASLENFII